MTGRSDRPRPGDGVAWITGASSGLGRAVARELAARGWTVAASARRAAALDSLAAEAAPGRIHPLPCDLTAPGAAAAAVARIEAEIGPLALAILNAGTHLPDRIDICDLDACRAVLDLNIGATLACAAAAAGPMVGRRRGQIVLVGSLAGYRGLPGAIAYGGSKAALANMAEAMAFDLHPRGVGVQIVNPGFVRTPLTDANRFAMPFLMEADAAARRLVRGLASRRFEIAFPLPMVLLLKAVRWLPPRLYLALVARATGWAGRR